MSEIPLVIKLKDMASGTFKGTVGAIRSGALKMESAIRGVKNAVFSLKGALVGLGAAMVAKSFITAAAEAEKFKTQLWAILGRNEELAASTFKWVREFAASLPFTTSQVVQSFVTLKAVGINVTREMLKTIGDTAYAMDKNITDVAQALVSGETEVLRRLGVVLDRAGDYATVKTGKMVLTVRNNMEAIRNTIVAVWETSFAGSMQRAEKDWAGILALMESQWWEFKVAVMEGGAFEALKTVFKAVGDAVTKSIKTGDFQKTAKDVATVLVDLAAAFVSAAKVAVDAWHGVRLGLHEAGIAALQSMKFIFKAIKPSQRDMIESVLDLWIANQEKKVAALLNAADTWEGRLEGLRLLIKDIGMVEVETGDVDIEDYLEQQRRAAALADKINETRKEQAGTEKTITDEIKDQSRALEETKRHKEVLTRNTKLQAEGEKLVDEVSKRVAANQAVIKSALEGIGSVLENKIMSAFGDLLEGKVKPLREYVKETLKDLTKMAVQAAVKSAVKGVIAAVFAEGGIVQGGFKSLRRVQGYAGGGRVKSGDIHMGVVGEGPTDEIVVPIPGGEVPVRVKNRGGGQPPIQNFQFVIQGYDTKSGAQFIMEQRDTLKAMMFQMGRENPSLMRAMSAY